MRSCACVRLCSMAAGMRRAPHRSREGHTAHTYTRARCEPDPATLARPQPERFVWAAVAVAGPAAPVLLTMSAGRRGRPRRLGRPDTQTRTHNICAATSRLHSCARRVGRPAPPRCIYVIARWASGPSGAGGGRRRPRRAPVLRPGCRCARGRGAGARRRAHLGPGANQRRLGHQVGPELTAAVAGRRGARLCA